MAEYRLTRQAETDFMQIGRYTQQNWGPSQRRAYLGDLVAAFEHLATRPELGRSRDDLRPNLLSYACGRHVIFFRRKVGRVEVLRILHGRQSVEKAFSRR